MSNKLSIVILGLVFCLNTAYSQQSKVDKSFAVSENGKYFGYITTVSKEEVDLAIAKKYNSKEDIYELRYYELTTRNPILKYQFYSSYLPTLKISFDGKTIALFANSTYIINAFSKSLIANKTHGDNVFFPHFDNSYICQVKNSSRLNAFDTFSGKSIKSYKSTSYSRDYGTIYFSDDDNYMIQQKSFSTLNIWNVGNENKMKTILANTFKIDYAGGKITFVKGLKTTTYLLDDMGLFHQNDLKYFIRDFTKQKRVDDKTILLKFGAGIISNSGNFMILPFTQNNKNSLMLCSTQRNENKEIPIDDLAEVNNIAWLNDSVLILNHENNTTTLLNLYDYNNSTTIDFGLSTKKYIVNKELNISPNYQFYVTSKTKRFVQNFTLHHIKSNTEQTIPNLEFITYSPTGNYLVVKNLKTGIYGVIHPTDKNLIVLPFSDKIPAIYEPENLQASEIPKDYNPRIIKAFKDISELKDTSAIINLLLKNIEYTDSTISLNTHLIDDNGVYYYGASAEKWKHIWCNLLLKSGNKKLQQITDFEVIEHRDNIFLPYGTAIVMDHSGSIGQERALKLQEAVDEYIKQKINQDAIALIKFDNRVGVESYPSKNKGDLLASLQKVGLEGYGGGTSILDAANAAISILKNYDDYLKNTLVILTDGMENSSHMSKIELIQRAIENKINIYIIGYGDFVDKNYLKSITNPTKGSFYDIYSEKDFEWIFKDIHLKVRNFYEIKFKSDYKGEQKVMLKVCITNNHSDTLAFNFNNVPYPKANTKDTLSKAGAYELLESEYEIDKLSGIGNINNFDSIKSRSYEPKMESNKRLADKWDNLVEDEFEQIELADIKFEYNTVDIVQSTKKVVGDLYRFLVKNSYVKIEIAGHTDADGDNLFNMELSERRAEKIKSILITKGILENRIITKSYGDLFPKVPNTTEENKQINRRVEFRIVD